LSVEAITWALSQPVPQSSTKFVLVVLANHANADHVCWPSMKYVCESTGQDRKTVLTNIHRLKQLGLIEDTSNRSGQTKQIIVYRLCVERVPKTEQSQKRNSTVFPVKQAQNSLGTVPKTGHGTIKEPSIEPSIIKPLERGCPNCPTEKIVEAYHQALPTLRKVLVMSDKRKALVRQRWRECFEDGDFADQEGGVDAFTEYFTMVSKSDFLCGRVNSNRPFEADFEWLMISSNFIKVIEGKYHGDQKRNGSNRQR